MFFHVWAVRQIEDFIQGQLARFRAQAIALRVWREQIVFIRISSIVNIESSCLGESHEWKAFRYPRFFEVSFGFYLSSFAFYKAAFFQWLLFDHIWLNKACHNLRRVFNLSMYITNIIPHGKCFVRCLHTRCFQKSHSFASLTCSISDTPQLVCKHRTSALSMKYSIFIPLPTNHML